MATYTGSTGNDTLTGSTVADILYGGDGNDLLNGLAGADQIFGGNGTDTASYTASTLGVNVNLSANTGSGGDAAGDTFSLVENVTGSGLGDTLTGDGNVNVLTGAAGNDLLYGGLGIDSL